MEGTCSVNSIIITIVQNLSTLPTDIIVTKLTSPPGLKV